VHDFLLKYPEYVPELKKIYEYEKNNDVERGWKYSDVGVHPSKLTKMVSEGILTIKFKSRSQTRYRITNPEEIQEYFKDKQTIIKNHNSITHIDSETLDIIAKEINEQIVGNEHAKRTVIKTLETDKKVNVLIHGDPASGKSLVGEIISKHIQEPTCVYITATDLSAAGLYNILEATRPLILIIDEIDKIKNKADLDTLHSLMWEGKIRRVKGDYISEWIEMNTKVIGIANDITKLRYSILSRFLILKTESPTKEGFIEICIKAIKKENPEFEDEMAKHIASKIYDKNKNVRSAVMIANLYPEDIDEVDELINALNC